MPDLFKTLVCLLGFLSVIIGVIFVVISRRRLKRVREFCDRATRTEGIVQSLETQQGEHGTYQYPLVSFVDAVGHRHVFKPSHGVGQGCPQPGTRLPVLYDPTQPNDARIDSFRYLWLVPALLMTIGGWGLIAGPLVVWHFWTFGPKP